jgi:lipase maturation factor 1
MWWQKYKDAGQRFHKQLIGFTQPSLALIVSGISFCYFLAFLSLIPQLPGLIGDHGLLPVRLLKNAYYQNYGILGIWEMKSLAWWVHSGLGLQVVATIGLVSSLLAVLGRFRRASLLVSWIVYGSLFVAGQSFLSFQWDSLLLESGIVALCMTFALQSTHKETWSTLLLVRLLASKVMLSAGLAKWTSGDIWWREGTALMVHFETQPLPTILGWMAHQLSGDVLLWGMAFMWVSEIIAPLLAFIPGRTRFYSALCMLLFQGSILLTGNYGFFNILTMVLILSFWVKETPETANQSKAIRKSPLSLLRNFSVPKNFCFFGFKKWGQNMSPSVLAKHSIPLLLSLTLLLGVGNRFFFHSPNLGLIERTLAEWRIQFQYGLFSVMTYPRWELSFSLSEDKSTGHEVPFYYKPTTLNKLPWVTPYMPRLDWMMWFAALHPAPQQLPWIQRLGNGLLTKTPDILRLLPPLPEGDFRYIQIHRRQYRFTDIEEYEKTGNYWVEATQVY